MGVPFPAEFDKPGGQGQRKENVQVKIKGRNVIRDGLRDQVFQLKSITIPKPSWSFGDSEMSWQLGATYFRTISVPK